MNVNIHFNFFKWFILEHNFVCLSNLSQISDGESVTFCNQAWSFHVTLGSKFESNLPFIDKSKHVPTWFQSSYQQDKTIL